MDSRLVKHTVKPLLLKDYLLDDMSSCSSNGFRSFPRRQCCATTVRFLIEIDHKNTQHVQRKKKNINNNYFNFNKTCTPPPPLPKIKPSKSALAALQSVITAVKRLPFAPGSKKLTSKSILPRSLSKKILKKSSFWKRKSSRKDIGRWKSFDQLLKEDSEPSDIPNSSTTTRDSKSCWSSRGDIASSEVNLDLPEVRSDDSNVESLKKGDVSTDSTTTSDSSYGSTTTTTNSSTKQKQWCGSEDKEQFSPVSVLDCPFDDDEEVSSPFQHRLARMEGTQKKLMKKMKRFGCLTQLEPVSLAKQFALHPRNSDSEPILQHSSASTTEKVISDNEDERDQEDDENQTDKKALSLLHQMTTSASSYGLTIKADKLLLDFFRERIIARKNVHSQGLQCGENSELLEEAENWIHEQKPRESFLGWEIPRNRQAYIKDMEKGREWKSLDEEYEEVATELEAEVFAALLNELLLDISSKSTV